MSNEKIILKFKSEEELNQYKKDFLLSGLTNRVDEFNKFISDNWADSELKKDELTSLIVSEVNRIFGVSKK